jgi:hypothetical protein
MTGYTFNQLFDFTRTTSATFVGSNGLIQTTPASVNLLLQTQAFDNAVWTKSNATVTANVTTAPDGTLTADKLIDNATNGGHNTSQSCSLISGVSYTLSAYAKKDDLSFCAIGVYDAATKYQTFDLNTGAKGSNSGITGSTIDPVGNGWYRVSITFIAAITGTCYPTVYLINSTTFAGYVGSGTGVFFWGAQIEAGSTATTYTRNNGGLYPARFDYDPVTLAPKGILIEEQRTNLLVNSSSLSSVNFAGGVRQANQLVAPDGTLSASIINGAGAVATWTQSSVATATTMTFTCFVKIGVTSTRTSFQFLMRNTTTAIDFTTGTFSTVDGTITGAGWTSTSFGNGWYRIAYTNSGAQVITVGNTITSYFGGTGGTVYAATDALGIWGAQLEAGAFATSYIPTVASQVTRSADLCAITAPMFSPWYNQSEGTFVFEGTVFTTSAFTWPVIASNNTVAQAFATYRSGASIAGFIATSSVTQLEITASPVVVNVPFKMAVSAQANSGNFSFNGNIGTTDTSITMPTVNRLSLGSSANNAAEYLNGHIRSIKYYPFRASNNQLQALTI